MCYKSEDKAELFNAYFAEQSNLDDGWRKPNRSDIEQARTHLENIYISHASDNLKIHDEKPEYIT